MIRYLKRLKSLMFVCVKAFPMYGGIGVSTPSLHRQSTNSLIHKHSRCAHDLHILSKDHSHESHSKELGCGRLLHALNPLRSAFLLQEFFAQCHPYILLFFTDFYTCKLYKCKNH